TPIDHVARAWVVHNIAAHDSPRSSHDAQDGLSGHGLAAARLADHTQGPAVPQRVAQPIHSPNRALVEREMHPQVADFEQQRAISHQPRVLRRASLHHYRPYGSAASRSPSPRKLKAMIVTSNGSAGSISQGAKPTAWRFCES